MSLSYITLLYVYVYVRWYSSTLYLLRVLVNIHVHVVALLRPTSRELVMSLRKVFSWLMHKTRRKLWPSSYISLKAGGYDMFRGVLSVGIIDNGVLF